MLVFLQTKAMIGVVAALYATTLPFFSSIVFVPTSSTELREIRWQVWALACLDLRAESRIDVDALLIR
jgi:hypothetical protein